LVIRPLVKGLRPFDKGVTYQGGHAWQTELLQQAAVAGDAQSQWELSQIMLKVNFGLGFKIHGLGLRFVPHTPKPRLRFRV